RRDDSRDQDNGEDDQPCADVRQNLGRTSLLLLFRPGALRRRRAIGSRSAPRRHYDDDANHDRCGQRALGVPGGWVSDVVRGKFGGLVASLSLLRRQDPARGQSGRSSRGAADEVRAGHQPQDRQGSRIDDPAIAAAAGGSGHRIVDSTSLPFLLPWPRMTLLICRILSSQWDEATWPIAKHELVRALQLRSALEPAGWWKLDTRGQVLRAARRFLALAAREPEVRRLHRCFDNWRGIGDVVAGMATT